MIYINDIDDNTTSGVIKFADDTKVYGMSATEEEVKGLQMDLDKMFDWSVDWQMLFNVGKCKVIHAGYNNRGHVYKMNGRELESIEEEKDLGVIVHKSLSPSRNVAAAVKKANRVLGIISRTFTYKSEDIMLPIYKCMVTPLLGYCVQAWSPFLVKDINSMEKYRDVSLV